MIKYISKYYKVIISGLFLLIMGSIFFLAPFLNLQDPTSMNYTALLKPPNSQFLLGTDNFGRDILSRIIYGGRLSFVVGLSSTIIAFFIGGLLGLIAGYYQGYIGFIIMRVMDFLISFPPILLAIFVVGILGGNLINLILVIGILYIPRIARVAYGQCITKKEDEYIVAMKSMGARDTRILFKGLLPNIMGPVVVQASIIFAYALLLESGLSFLGLGVQPPTPTLGGMISAARSFMNKSIYPLLWPSLSLSLLVLSANMFSEGLREKLDPIIN